MSSFDTQGELSQTWDKRRYPGVFWIKSM